MHDLFAGQKHRLHLADDGFLHLEMAVTPMLGILRVASPLRRDSNAAGQSDGTIDDQQLAVCSVVEPADVIPAWRVIPIGKA